MHTPLSEVTECDTAARRVKLIKGAELTYDYLIVAAGARHAYFGRDEWERDAPGLKTIEDAVEIRQPVSAGVPNGGTGGPLDRQARPADLRRHWRRSDGRRTGGSHG